MNPRIDPLPDAFAVYEKSRHAAVIEDGRRMAWCLTFLFGGFFVFNAFDFQPPARTPMLIFDAALIVFFAAVGAFAQPGRLGRIPGDALGAALGLLTGANILTAAFFVGADVLYTAYLGLTIIGTATVMLSLRWFAGMVLALGAVWGVLVGRRAPLENIPDEAFILIAAGAVALVLLANRARGFARLQRMRAYSAALLGQRTPLGVAMAFGRFTALLTDSPRWAVEWFPPLEGKCWTEGPGGLAALPGLDGAARALPPGATETARPFVWGPVHRRLFDTGPRQARGVLGVPLMGAQGARAVLWLARHGFRQHTVAQWDLAEICATQARAALNAVALLDEVKSLAITDELTGLFNRRQFFFLAERENARRRGPGPGGVAVVMADIDHFKKVNDTHGHGVGDIVLKEVARRLKNGLRLTDVVGRYGGEEFAVLLPDTSPEAAREVVERLRHAVAATPIEAEGRSLTVTASFGIASRSVAGENLEHLLTFADRALYRAKDLGRNRVEVHAP